MQNLKIALLQIPLIWESPEEGLTWVQSFFNNNLPEADLYILPEMFNTGFSMKPEKLFSTYTSEVCQWMQDWAGKQKKYLCGSIIFQENEKYYNRLLVYGPEGMEGYYDKRHLFRMAEEDLYFSYGKQKLILNIKGWNICFWICYDLRFPVWMRNTHLEYDLGVIVANWPERRATHWQKLLPARAIENQAYIAGLNRIGKDGNDIIYSGDSIVINPLGEEIVNAGNKQGWHCAELEYETLKNYREKFAAWRDADDFIIP